MKMICPHCGVKGSADSALLGRKVKCPKCIGIFEVEAEVVESIEVVDLELEQLPEQVDEHFDTASEAEIDDVFSKLLGGGTEDAGSENTQRDIDSLLGEAEGSGQGDMVAALSDPEDDTSAENELFGEEQQDETLTIIEDFPEDVILGSDDAESYMSMEEEEITAALDGIDDAQQHEEINLQEEDSEEGEETLDFEDGFLDEETDAQQTASLEDETENIDDLSDEFFADEPEIDRSVDDDPETIAEELDAADESGEVEQVRIDSEDISTEDENILSASFIDDNLDEQLEQEEDESVMAPRIEKCSACDQYVDPEKKIESGGNVYCSKCIPAGAEIEKDNEELTGDGESAFPGLSETSGQSATDMAEDSTAGAVGRFTVTTLIKDAWHYSKGVKVAIWAGVAVMYIVLFGLAFAAIFLTMQVLPKLEPLPAMLVNGGVRSLISFFSFIFSVGILMIAVNRVGQQEFSWKMVFCGFKRLGSMIVLAVLQTIMLGIGFCLFIIPGIYLSVGYILSIPLVFVKGLSPWQAMETSRKAVHKRWWTVFFTLIVMSIVVSLSAIPLGLGLIWTVPMFAVLIGVLFYHLFGADEDEEVFE